MLEAVNLTKTYGDQYALSKLNLKINKGEVFCMLGANGAGKTTTINLFLNFIQPDAGAAYVNGIDVSKKPLASKKHIAYIPENLMLYPNLSGMENLEYFSKLGGKKHTKEEHHQFLSAAGLQQEAHTKRIGNFSKGMRQKVGIAIALAKDADVLLLDEPTSGLDPKASNEFAQIIKNLTTKGVAILMATHDLFRAKETGTHIGIMKQGTLVESFKSEDSTFENLEKLYLKHMHV